MHEAVRLVIWDLDETYWRGTLTEGGIQEYVQDHHDLVIELSQRGILNSVCSKNDRKVVLKILEDYGIAEYFVFPSISWESKGHRLAQMIEDFQLRPATVMFIDDNPNNRAEASAVVDGIQVEDETFTARMLLDPRFRGKDDGNLSRLRQYKLLEQKKKDEQSSSSSNRDFLRSCDVRVYIEHDVEKHIDRAVELVNRTNQLNYTKARLPEDAQAARNVLRAEMAPFSRQAGLVHVRDRYGDYGFVGFFIVQTFRRRPVDGSANRTLRHFCFSCRTLGMLVEKYVYDLLGRPELHVVGDVLTDLSEPVDVDWISPATGPETDQDRRPPIATSMRMLGGCEANALSVYMEAHCNDVRTIANHALDGMFVRVNSSPLALSLLTTTKSEESAEAKLFGLPIQMSAADFFDNGGEAPVFLLSLSLDAMTMAKFIRNDGHIQVSLEINGDPAFNLQKSTSDEVQSLLSQRRHLTDEQKARIMVAADHLRANYCCETTVSEETRSRVLATILDRVPDGSRVIFILDHDRMRGRDGNVIQATFVARYNDWLRQQLQNANFVGVVSFSDVIASDSEIQPGGNHYERMVYYRMSELIRSTLAALPRKGLDEDASTGTTRAALVD